MSPISENFYRVAAKANRQIENELPPLISTGIGGSIPNKIIEYDGRFEYPKPMTIEQGRCLLFKCTKIALKVFNADQSIQPFLNNTPFDKQNISISICSANFLSVESPKGFADSVAFIHGTLFYGYYDHTLRHFVDFHKESYEEALARCSESFNYTSDPAACAHPLRP